MPLIGIGLSAFEGSNEKVFKLALLAGDIEPVSPGSEPDPRAAPVVVVQSTPETPVSRPAAPEPPVHQPAEPVEPILQPIRVPAPTPPPAVPVHNPVPAMPLPVPVVPEPVVPEPTVPVPAVASQSDPIKPGPPSSDDFTFVGELTYYGGAGTQFSLSSCVEMIVST